MGRMSSVWLRVCQALYEYSWFLRQKSAQEVLRIVEEVFASLLDTEATTELSSFLEVSHLTASPIRSIQGGAYAVDFSRGIQGGEQIETMAIYPVTRVGYRLNVTFKDDEVDGWQLNTVTMPDPDKKVLKALTNIRRFVDRVVLREEELERESLREAGKLVSMPIPFKKGTITDPAEEPDEAS